VPLTDSDKAARFGGVTHGFQLYAFARSLVLPLDAVAKHLDALSHELNDQLSQGLLPQLEHYAARKWQSPRTVETLFVGV
jgi:hypothetical protein